MVRQLSEPSAWKSGPTALLNPLATIREWICKSSPSNASSVSTHCLSTGETLYHATATRSSTFSFARSFTTCQSNVVQTDLKINSFHHQPLPTSDVFLFTKCCLLFHLLDHFLTTSSAFEPPVSMFLTNFPISPFHPTFGSPISPSVTNFQTSATSINFSNSSKFIDLQLMCHLLVSTLKTDLGLLATSTCFMFHVCVARCILFSPSTVQFAMALKISLAFLFLSFSVHPEMDHLPALLLAQNSSSLAILMPFSRIRSNDSWVLIATVFSSLLYSADDVLVVIRGHIFGTADIQSS